MAGRLGTLIKGMLAVAILVSIVPSLVPDAVGRDEFAATRKALAEEAPNWKLYCAEREGAHVVYYVHADPVLSDEDPEGRDDYGRMTLTLWSDASEYWASLPPSDDTGTCIIVLSWAGKAITTDGNPVEIVRISQLMGAAQADIAQAMHGQTYDGMGDREFVRWFLQSFPSAVYSPEARGESDSVLCDHTAQLYEGIVREKLAAAAAVRSIG